MFDTNFQKMMFSGESADYQSCKSLCTGVCSNSWRCEACDSGQADGDSRTDTGCSSEEIQPRLDPKAITQHAVKRSFSAYAENTGQEVLHFRDSGVDGDF